MGSGRRLGIVACALVAGALAPGAAIASAAQEGPPLTINAGQVDRALECSPGLERAQRDPVLLTPAFSTAAESYAWNYRQRLPALGIPTCSITVDDHGYGDLQLTSEYVVAAVRRMTAASKRKVVLLGHQHGALDELWAVRFWPDVARSTSDFVSLATPYNGTESSAGLCRPGGRCAPSLWQITKGSRYLAAMSRAPLPRGPGYTSIATRGDVLITPQPEASRLDGASNVLVQDVCPGRVVDHFAILADAAAYALVLDALGHPGGADPSRIPRSACAPLFMPGVNGSALGGAAGFLSGFVTRNASEGVPSEPPVRPYAARSGPALAAGPRRVRLRRGVIGVRVRCASVARTRCRARLVLTGPRGRRLGSRLLSTRPRQTTVVRVPIGRRGRALLSRHPRTRARATLRAQDALDNRATLTRRIVVGRPPRRR